MIEDGPARAGNQRRIQMRAPRKDGFTEDRRQVFLDHLAACCNLGRAAAAAGVSAVTINYHRRRDPAFAAQFDDALEDGYAALEAAMVERAAGAVRAGAAADVAPGPDSIDSTLGLHLLSIRKAKGAPRTGRRAGRPPLRATDTELNEAILAKLDILDRRLAAGRPIGFRGRKGTVAEGRSQGGRA